MTELYTGIGEVMGSYFLGDFFARLGHASRVKRSLLLTWEDLKTENIVVLGLPAENFFLRDLPPQKQDFIFSPCWTTMKIKASASSTPTRSPASSRVISPSRTACRGARFRKTMRW